MKLTRFRIQNYKCIEDTNWINIGNLTALVGKNESGKTSILRALHKFNPAEKDPYNGLYEFPRSRFTEFPNQDWLIVSVEFEIDEILKRDLIEKHINFKDINSIIFHKCYSGKLSYEIPNFNFKYEFNTNFKELNTELKRITRGLVSNNNQDEFPAFKEAIIEKTKLFNEKIKQFDDNNFKEKQEIFNEFFDSLSTLVTQDWQKQIMDPVNKILKEYETVIEKEIEEIDLYENSIKSIHDNIPVFIYFDFYNIIDNKINLEDYIRRLHSEPYDPKIRAITALFKYCGFDAERVSSIGDEFSSPNRRSNTERPSEDVIPEKDERTIIADSASLKLTKKFLEMWSQRHHQFQFQLDGKYFRVWVSDEKEPAKIPLEDRSKGLQWYFSFTILFEVESEYGHKNSILLLDEPGLNLHPRAQLDFVRKNLMSLSENNQIIYTTHSPFMIDDEFFEGVRIVEEQENGKTLISENFAGLDKDSVFPIQAALDYSISQTLFQGKKILIVEGMIDYYLLRMFSSINERAGNKGLSPDVIITPAGGTSKILPLVSLIIGQDIKFGILLDSDKVGKSKKQKLEKELLKGDESNRIILIGDIINLQKAEIEDTIPRTIFLNAITQSYNFNQEVELNETEEKQLIIDAINSFFNRKEISEKFDKWKPVEFLINEWKNCEIDEIDNNNNYQ